MKKINIILILFILLSLLSCKRRTNSNNEEPKEQKTTEKIVYLTQQQQKALKLKIGSFEMRNLTTVVKVNGQLNVAPENKAEITAIIGGNVKAIKVFDGDKVYKGQILAVLEHPDYIKLQEDFAVISNNLNFLKQEYKRQKELFDNNVGAGKNYQKAKSDYNIAKAKYQGLKSRLLLIDLSPEKVKNGQISNTINIVSPISGLVTEVNIKLGTYVDAQDKIFEITKNSAIHADFLIYEKDIHLLKIGQTIHFTVSNHPNEEFSAIIFAIGKKFDSKTRAIHIHAKINRKSKSLIPGMYISGHLHTDKKFVRTLPNDAIVKQGAKSYIFVVDNDKDKKITAFKMIEVITGQSDENYTTVDLIDSLPENTQIALNSAYYILADMNKEETGDDD